MPKPSCLLPSLGVRGLGVALGALASGWAVAPQAAADSVPPFETPSFRGEPGTAVWEWNDFGFIGSTFVSAPPDVANPASNPGTAVLNEQTGNAIVASSRNVYCTFGQLAFVLDVPGFEAAGGCGRVEVILQVREFHLVDPGVYRLDGVAGERVNLEFETFDPPIAGQPAGELRTDLIRWVADGPGPFEITFAVGSSPDELIGFSLDRVAVDTRLIEGLCAADINGDCALDLFDILGYFGLFAAGEGDLTGDGQSNVFDILEFFALFASC